MARVAFTDPELADAAGTTKQQIHKLRHGERKLTVQWAKRLAPILGFTWQELIEGPSEAADPRRAALLAAYDSLDPRDRETLLRVAESLRRDDSPSAPLTPEERSPLLQPSRGGDESPRRGRTKRPAAQGASTTAPGDEPLPPQLVDLQEELAWLAFWRERSDPERREVLRMLNLSDRARI